MNKLSLFKWIYNLGYKKAEDRYYYALMEIIRDKRYNNPNVYRRPTDTEEEQKIREAYEYRFFNELRVIVDEVFHPQEYVEIQPKDRFLP